ncbi:hypothetical protein HMPREF1982_03551 [Clostridiales bacterium oral taxon 876 str. F0540]|nr:hypothetical protein HMPREF1982_03551 [Clostridiales bacterium oral taxon 876 str. F0540]
MIIDDIKTLLDIQDNSKDNIFNIYIRRATTVIQNYLNNSTFTGEYIETNFPDAIIDIVVNAYNFKGKNNIKSITQGARSVTYSDNTAFCVTESVANMLPTPYLRMC